MPKWRFDVLNLSVVHLGNRYLPTPARLFKESAVKQLQSSFQNFQSELEHRVRRAKVGCEQEIGRTRST